MEFVVGIFRYSEYDLNQQGEKWLPFVTSHLGDPENSKVSLYWDDVFPGCSPGPDKSETNN